MKPAPPVTSTRSPTRRRLRIGRRPLAAGAVALLAAVALSACGGGSGAAAPRRAAEPAESPPLRVDPAGRSATVGSEPEGVVWDAAADLVAVGIREPPGVAFVDPESLEVVHRVSLPAPPRHLTYDPAGGTVLVPAESANELLVVRLSGVVTATKVGTHPHDATSVGGNVFVADEHSDQVSVLRKGHLVKTLPTPHQPGGIAGVAENWVALVGEAAAPGTPYGLAVDPMRSRLWVTDTATNRLTEYSTVGELPRRIASYPTVRQPNSVTVDERTGAVFVAGREAGVLERITPDRSVR
jgi:DNA-binding beta-propeller fold protein YncE